jgi:hypothetical protein
MSGTQERVAGYAWALSAIRGEKTEALRDLRSAKVHKVEEAVRDFSLHTSFIEFAMSNPFFGWRTRHFFNPFNLA